MVRGAALMWSGGAPSGYLPENFRWLGRFMWRDLPVIYLLPASVPATVIFVAVAGLVTHGSVLGRLWLAIGDNPRAAELAGVPVRLVRVSAFIASGLSAVLAGILLGGFRGRVQSSGRGAGTAGHRRLCVRRHGTAGRARHGGRRRSGALSLFALFTLLNLLGMPEPLRDAVQGVILIGAVALQMARRTS